MLTRGVLLFATIALVLAPLAGAGAAETEGATGFLFAHWPEEAVPGTGVEVPMNVEPPIGEADLSSGAAVPGASGSMGAAPIPTFIYTFVNATGAKGPDADVALTGEPAHLIAYFSADQAAVPSALPVPPEQNPDYGVAPMVTLEAQIEVGGEVVGTGSLTQDLISTPAQVVYEYNVPMELSVDTIPAKAGITVTFWLYQVDQDGQRTMQNMWNINTGEEYPTGLHLPVENVDALLGLVPTEAVVATAADDPDDEPNGVPVPVVLVPAAAGLAALARRRRHRE